MNDLIDVVFDGFPGPEGPRFIEVETSGKSLEFGEWRDLRDGYTAWSFPNPRSAMEGALARLNDIYDPNDEDLYRVRRELEDMINEFPRPSK